MDKQDRFIFTSRAGVEAIRTFTDIEWVVVRCMRCIRSVKNNIRVTQSRTVLTGGGCVLVTDKQQLFTPKVGSA